jgi:cobalt-precorrin-5B (C1)-methyltransferase
MTRKPDGPLRRGWTTGACAAAAAKAAWTALLTGRFPDPVAIRLPGGQVPRFALASHRLDADSATAGIVKDAGDDPDVTHGALVRATVRRGPPGSGIAFRGGEGVGRVTRPGLPLAVGEPAINPAPRAMIAAALAEATPSGAATDAEVTISIPGGEGLAEKTWNPKLGIVGGLSILGTTGIVNPYSCSAWIASIQRGIDVCRANGLGHAAACTGSSSEAAVRRHYDLPEIAIIDMGDFAGGTLKYLRRHPLPRLTLAGGVGKLAKLAQGALDLHSGRSQLDRPALAASLAAMGAAPALVERAAGANTASEILDEAAAAGLPLGDHIAGAAQRVARELVEGKVSIEVMLFDRAGRLAGHAGF